jgi:serine O-acetyltransferase
LEWALIESWSDFRRFVAADFRSRGQQPSLKWWLFDPVARVTWLMRLDAYLLNTGKPRVLRLPITLWFRRLCVRLGFSLGPNIFGPGVAIVHYGLLVIDPTTRIGKNCRIHMGTHIGGAAQFVAPGEEHLHSPRIGDNAYLGPGCKIYGPVRLGNDVVVGANAVVTKSFADDGITLAGIPAKVIATGGSGERVLRGAN